MRDFATDKNFDIASRLFSNINGKERNEITQLSYQFSDMIMELKHYMYDLLVTSRELKDTKQRADEMNALANKDSLTGIGRQIQVPLLVR